MFRNRSALSKSSYQPPSTILDVKLDENINRKLGIYQGTSVDEIYCSLKAIFDIPAKYRISLRLEDDSEFAISESMPPKISCKLIKMPAKRTMWYRDITGEWMQYIPQRKRRKLEVKKVSEKKKEESQETTPKKANFEEKLFDDEVTISPIVKIPKVVKVPVKVLSNSDDDAHEGYVGAAACKGEDAIYVCGGINEDGEVIADMSKWDLEENEWDLGDEDEPRAYHSFSWIKSREQFFVFGGYELEDDEIVPLEKPRGMQEDIWFPSQLQGDKPAARYGHSMSAIDDDRLFLFGGFDKKAARNDCRILDAQDWTWKTIKASSEDAPSARGFHTATLVGKKLVLIGGCNMQECFDTIYVLDVESWSWSRPDLKGEKFSPRCKHKAVVLDETKIAILGGQCGYDTDADKVPETCILDTATWTISSLPLLYGLSSLSVGGHVVCKVDNEDTQVSVWLFGGNDNLVRLLKL